MFIRVLKVTGLIVLGSLTLTACDPPMPPEVLAALAEQSYTCVSGDTQLSAPAVISAVAGDWQTSASANCAGMTITPAAAASDKVELQIGDPADKSCQAYAQVPFALDAPVIAVKLSDITNVNLSADAIEKIWSGAITNWNDPALAALNPSFQLPSTPITFGTEATGDGLKAFDDWMTRLAGHAVVTAGGTANLAKMAEGALLLTSYSAATAASLPMVAIAAKAGTDGIVPEMGSINSAATMYKSKVTNGVVALTFDSSAKPIAPEGVAVAPTPYQAIEVIPLRLCGTDTLKTRAAAKYILRQDSQGSLGLSTVIALPETLRAIALTAVSKGLPQPSLTPASN